MTFIMLILEREHERVLTEFSEIKQLPHKCPGVPAVDEILQKCVCLGN